MSRAARDLDCIEKRDLLASAKLSQQDASAYGQAFLELGMLHDALAFFLKADDRHGLAKLLDVAIAEADHGILWQLAKTARIPVMDDDWRRCARRAMETGKHSVAAYIFKRLGDEAGLASLPERWRPKGDQPAPAQTSAGH
ncbi:MAG TPA: hypothetical protein P5137_11780 [Candidatus Brocadiia bacterium]|nr:hypothetical protein [Candidatus Brocadiia bacterium]